MPFVATFAFSEANAVQLFVFFLFGGWSGWWKSRWNATVSMETIGPIPVVSPLSITCVCECVAKKTKWRKVYIYIYCVYEKKKKTSSRKSCAFIYIYPFFICNTQRSIRKKSWILSCVTQLVTAHGVFLGKWIFFPAFFFTYLFLLPLLKNRRSI